ncbi:DUF2505 domain-containing protein [Aeromicrobium alkaliterrae]|uniref:DUF2505 domain-containing protein n=1 Tax=Aeromicrobium alkaliterrae TaxID=302168 RepID=A0ABN2JSE1_9ACTN
MKLSETFTYDATVDEVYGLITSEAFRTETCEDQGALEHDVSVQDGVVTIVRSMPAELPDFVKKLTGPTVKVKQTEKWTEGSNGSRHADVKVSIVGQPAEMLGTAELTDDGKGGTVFTVKGDVKVSIPLLGRKIEPEIHKQIVRSINAEVELGKTKI